VSFEFGDWDFFGILELEFGIFQRPQSKGFSGNSITHLA
jgi:hypothetical protein